MLNSVRTLFTLLLVLCALMSNAQAYEDCSSAQSNSVTINSFPFTETITIDPSWTNDTDYLPAGLSGNNSTAYWAFTVNSNSYYNLSYSSSGGNAIQGFVSIGLSDMCPISGSEEVYFGNLSSIEEVICKDLSISTTYVLVFAVDQGNEGDITITIEDVTAENDKCNLNNSNILTVSNGSTSCADYDVNTCDINDPENDHQIFYVYTNTTGANVDLEIEIESDASNGNPATQVSLTALKDDCLTFFAFYEGGPLSNSEWCHILDAGVQTLPCIEDGETMVLLISSVDGEEGDFTMNVNEVSIQPIDNNDECENAFDISPPATCEWQLVSVDNTNACPEDFSIPGECQFDLDPIVWYSFTVPAVQGFYTLEIQNISDVASYLALFDNDIDCDAPGTTSLGGDCETGQGPHSEFDPLTPGQTYLIAFGNPSPGLYSFEFKINKHPDNDECFDAEVLIPFVNEEGSTFCATQEIGSYNSGVCTDADETNTVWYEVSVGPAEKGFNLTLTSSGINPIFGDINVVVFETTSSSCVADGTTFVDEDCVSPGVIIEQFECIGEGTYLIRVSTSDSNAGDFDILFAPLVIEQPNDYCNAPDQSLNPGLENIWMTASANTTGACPQSFDFANDCGFDDFPVVWYEVTATANAELLDLQINSGGINPFIAVFEASTDCENLEAVNGSGCYSGTFMDLETIGESQIEIISGTTYLIGVGTDNVNGNIVDFGIKWITSGAPCPNGESIGDPCDDGDACTIDDTINEDCECEGTFQDSDGDGTCDAEDVCPGGPEPGTACDDEDDCTIEDVINEDCECVGTFQDTDGDGVCDAEDVCPDGPEPGMECDDEDDCTIDDTVNEDCECIGIFQDSDGDGTCDAEDVCPDGPEPGTACDDNDICTENDTINEDCACEGIYMDSDNDGTCDAEDVCPDSPEPGSACDDGDDCTIDDIVNEDCECVGTFQDSDGDGTCDADDVCPEGQEPGTPCDDENDCTVEDVINDDCFCVGTFLDSDFDGTCDAEDVCPGGPEPGTACDDGDDTTFNDQITMDCVCMGSTDTLYCPGLELYIGDPCDDGDECTTEDTVSEDCECTGIFQDSDGDGTCDAEDVCPDGPEPGTECDDENIATINDVINEDCICIGEIDTTYCVDLELYIGDNCNDNDTCTINDVVTEDCECLGEFLDSDGDGTCDAEDVCPDGPEPGTPCDDMDETTINDVINEECLCVGIVDSTYCDDLELYIGDNCNDNDTCTINDIVTEDCECLGEFQDSDGDGVCDAEDVCPDGPDPGSPCDDMNEETVNDMINEDCECVGEIVPDYCPDLDLFIGDACNDEDDCTVEDEVNEDCECVGVYQDTDGDGVCDAEDNCPGLANEDQLDTDMDGFGDVCDGDDDNDGIIDEEDNCPFTPNEDQLDTDMDGIGDACDTVNTQEENSLDVKIYPNPTQGILIVDHKEGLLNFRIKNIHGALIMNEQLASDRIDISNLHSGLYILEMFDENQSSSFHKILKY